MASLGEFMGSAAGSGGTIISWVAIVFAVICSLLIIFGIGAWWWFKKRWNLKVEIKLTRGDGKVTIGEWGKGYFSPKRGVCYIKRPGARSPTVPIKVFDIRRYLQGPDLITVIQVGPEDYRPVLNKSWLEHEVNVKDKVTGKVTTFKESVLNIQVDKGLNKAWKTAWTSAAKKAYTLQSFLSQFQTPIAIAIVILAVFVGFAMMWTKLGSVC